MSAATVEPQTASQQRAENDLGALELDELAISPPGAGDGDSGGGGDRPPPPPDLPPGRTVGYSRRRPPRWQLLLLWGIALILSFLSGFLIGRTATVLADGLIARAERGR